MLNNEKIDRFHAIARELITKEYLGVDGYGVDREFEDELTKAATTYLICIFENPSESGGAKEYLIEVMGKKIPNHPSNILKLIL